MRALSEADAVDHNASAPNSSAVMSDGSADDFNYGRFVGVAAALLVLCVLACVCWQVMFLRCQRCCQKKKAGKEEKLGLTTEKTGKAGKSPKLKRTGTAEIAKAISAQEDIATADDAAREDWAET